MNTDERKELTYDEALKLLPEGEEIHTFRSVPNMLIGADYQREPLLKKIKECGCELSGKIATATKHGIVLIDDNGPLFIETKDEEGVEK